MSIRALSFDLDGTLVDSAPDLANPLSITIAEEGLPGYSEAQTRLWVGNGVRALVWRALNHCLRHEPTQKQWNRCCERFFIHYQRFLDQSTRVFPYVCEVLDHLQARDYKLGCITNKPERFTDPLLRNLGLFDYFSVIVNGDSLPRKKPDPLPLRHAAKVLEIDPSEMVMVGDSIIDIQAAQAAGCKIIAVSYGYNRGDDICDTGPDLVIDHFRDLLPWLEGLAVC